MTPARALTLAGLRVVVTRPRAQAPCVAKVLAAHGADVVLLPALEIEPVLPDPAMLAGCAPVRAAIAVSVNAVHCGLPWLREHVPKPMDWRWFAVGPSTGAALRQFGIVATVPPRHDAIGLLSLPALRELGKDEVAILLRGEGGRKVLAKSLREQRVSVCELPVYRRKLPHAQPAQISTIVDSRQPTAVVVSSANAFDNLCALFGGHLGWLFGHALLAAVSERVRAHICETAASHGYGDAVLARLWCLSGATTQATLFGLEQNWNNWRRHSATQ